MKKSLFFIIAITTALLFSACSDGDTYPADDEPRKTVIIYMSAQNSLSGNATNDLYEISQGAAQLKKGETVVVYIDRNAGTEIYVFDQTHTQRTPAYTFSSNLDSSDPTTMTRMLDWVKLHYPAPDYGLVLWSHADGWLPPLNTAYTKADNEIQPLSFGIDDGNNLFGTNKGTSLSIENLAEVLEQSGMKFRYLLFDCCLMQCLEVDYELRNVADYIIASPISINVDGAYYTHQLTHGLFSDDPVDIARTYYDDVESGISSTYYMGIVVSAVKTEGLDSLATLTRELLADKTLPMWPDMSNVQAYCGYNSNCLYRPDYFDAGGVMSRLLPEAEYALWLEQLYNCIVYKAGTRSFFAYAYGSYGNFNLSPDFCGVSMFVPQQKYTANAALCKYGDLNSAWFKTSWAKAIGYPVPEELQ